MNKSDVVRHFGSQAEVARALGISPGAVWQWAEDLPEDRQAQIELLTGGRIKADIPNRGMYSNSAA